MTRSTSIRRHRLASVLGILVSIVGIVTIAVVAVASFADASITVDGGLGMLFIAIAGFLFTAAGSDIRATARGPLQASTD